MCGPLDSVQHRGNGWSSCGDYSAGEWTKAEDSVSKTSQKSNKELRLLAAGHSPANCCERIVSAEAFWCVVTVAGKVFKSESGRDGGGTNNTWTIAKSSQNVLGHVKVTPPASALNWLPYNDAEGCFSMPNAVDE